ncbi:hypothetical protein [Reticulibacter mediterranei]|nr:hypothetical protein [Reticulibacter mediterranei]
MNSNIGGLPEAISIPFSFELAWDLITDICKQRMPLVKHDWILFCNGT